MFKTLTVTKFKTYYQDFEKNADYNLRIEFVLDQDDIDAYKFGSQNGFIIYPHTFGVMDTNITDNEYECVILFDDKVPALPNNPFPYFAFLRKKLEKIPSEITPKETSKISQNPDEKVGVAFRGIKGPTGDSALLLGKTSAELVAGESKLVFSNSGISQYGDITQYSPPSTAYGGVMKDTGIMQFIPDVPPFGQVKIMPEMQLMKKVTMYLSVIKAFKEAL